jgi:hypothetical protein
MDTTNDGAIEMSETCERCGAPATIDNHGQPFCAACWDEIRDGWSCCLRCGRVFETDLEHADHVFDHRMYPLAHDLHDQRM